MDVGLSLIYMYIYIHGAMSPVEASDVTVLYYS